VKIFAVLSALLLISINAAVAGDIRRNMILPCEGPGCSVVAVKVVLDESSETKDLKIRIGSLVVEIPSNVTRIDIAKSSALTVFRYATVPHIAISTETEETFQMEKLTSKPITLFEALEIIFTKTIKDSDVTRKYDKEFINNLMWIKKGFMEGAKAAYVYEKGRVRMYYLSNGGPPYRNLAWAIDSKYPNTAIRIESDNSQNAFLKMLYSITLLNVKEI
jgi:hypothetical protein